ncbi:phenylalanine-tRNA ligase activity protein [Tritrichomonas musculus]|uniref:phenylalanine--tRNA ligase n=1 Tax=Tritrichomonas musculus TaxID=1915356 RepID=A0ABR2JDH3_9EUKA
MPIVSVLPHSLYELMGVEPMDDESLRTLLLQYGLELDDVTEDEEEDENGNKTKVKHYKIDVPANRPDLLSVESIAMALKVFRGGEHPNYTIVPPKLEITIEDSVDSVRGIIVCAVLRNIKFTQENYKSFIDLQDKLHHNLCRRRLFASIGTHDLNLCKPPFRYLAEKPEDIKFVPLNGIPNKELVEVDGRQLFKNIEEAHHTLAAYTPLLEEKVKNGDKEETVLKPLFPVVRDSEGVMSLPPIINSDRTKITLDTKDVFIECTALDQTRAMIAVVCLCSAFSLYTATPFTIEQVNVIKNGKTVATPNFDTIDFNVDLEYIKTITSIQDLTVDQVHNLLEKMMLQVSPSSDGRHFKVTVPAIRSDILHPCDIAEDVAISFGYNNVFKQNKKIIPSGVPLVRSEYIDRLSKEVAACRYIGICPFSLCSKADCFDKLLLPETPHIEIMNSKTQQFEMPRTMLLPCLLTTSHYIFNQPKSRGVLPLRLYLIDDVVLLDEKAENKTRNEHHFAAMIADTKSCFDKIHKLLDRFFVLNACNAADVKLVPQDVPTCIKGQRAAVNYKGNEIGWIGVIHPQVLINFGLTTPVVAFEICIDSFIEKHH